MGIAPLVMTWTGMASSAVITLAMADDAGFTRRGGLTVDPPTIPDPSSLGIGYGYGIDKRSRSRGRSYHNDDVARYSWENLPQSAVEDAEDAWGIKSPRKRLNHSSTWSWTAQAPDIEEGRLLSAAEAQ